MVLHTLTKAQSTRTQLRCCTHLYFLKSSTYAWKHEEKAVI